MSPEQGTYKLDEVLAADALLLGRVTYEGFAAAWPARSGEFADKMNAMPKYVASMTLQSVGWTNVGWNNVGWTTQCCSAATSPTL